MFEDFYDAAIYGDLEAIEEMLLENPKLINMKDTYGFTALHGVVSEEQPEMLELLIQKGAEVNAPNDSGITPIHLAAYPETIVQLSEYAADINHQAHDGSTPLHTHAAEHDNSDCIAALLELSANKTIKNNSGQTALDIAKIHQDVEKVQLLEA